MLTGFGDQNESRDTDKIAYSIHFLLDTGNFGSCNAFITDVNYFGSLSKPAHRWTKLPNLRPRQVSVQSTLPETENHVYQNPTVAPQNKVSTFNGKRYTVVEPNEQLEFWDVIRKIWSAAVRVVMIYTVTLLIFPRYLTENVEGFLRLVSYFADNNS
ncbi:hypothetical protein U1Q18_027027 [Sarracenia purpurea var. burkii]